MAAVDDSFNGDVLVGLEDGADLLFGSVKGGLARDLFVEMPSLGAIKIQASERIAANLDGDGVAWMDDEDSVNSMNTSRFAVVGRLIGPRLRLDYVKKVMTTKWGLSESPTVLPLGDRLFFFRLPNEEALRRALDDGPWIVGGQMLFLQEWTIDYTPARHMFTKMPVWLRLPHFPVGLWNRKNLIAIASLAGEPLEFDHSTLSQDRIKCARVKVLADLSAPLLRGISIGHRGISVWQPFLYEYFPVICTSCGLVGHAATKCTAPGPVNTSTQPAPAPASAPADKAAASSAGFKDRPINSQAGTGPPPVGNSTQAQETIGSSAEAGWISPKRRQRHKATRTVPFKAGVHALHSSNPFKALQQPAAFVQQGEIDVVDGVDDPSGELIRQRTSSYNSGGKVVPPPRRDCNSFVDRPDMAEIPESVLAMGDRIAVILGEACNAASSSRPADQPSRAHRGKGLGPVNLC